MNPDIPFSRPVMIGKELIYIEEAIKSGILHGDGPFSKQCEKVLEELTRSSKHLLTSSCTSALEMVALLLDLNEGDEVILPSYTFVSTANAFALRGVQIVFVDICPETKNIDPALVEAAITEKTKAIVVVNYGGVSCDLQKMRSLCDAQGIVLVEDAAQSLCASYQGRPLGSYGDLATFSFHDTKNIISGEGGSLAINNSEYIERAEIIREKGTNRSQFLAGQVDKYTWVDLGSSYLPSELAAAYLYAQLENAYEITNTRLSIWQYYQTSLRLLEEQGHFRMMSIPAGVEHNAHMFYLSVGDFGQRNGLLQYMKSKGVSATFHYVPLHSSPAGRQFGRVSGDLRHTNETYETLVRLPIYCGVDAERVVNTVTSYFIEVDSINS